MPITAQDGTTYSDAQVQQWMAGKSPDQIAQEAASLGLNQGQIQQALQIGGVSAGASDVTGYAQSHGMNFGGENGGAQFNVNANAAGGNAQGGSNGMTSGTLTTAGGHQIIHAQLAAFAASNPNDQQIMAQAAKWGMGTGDIATSLNNLGMLYNGGNPTSTQTNDPKNGSVYNRLNNLAYTGSTGYGSSDMTNPNTAITQGPGHVWAPHADGGGSWTPYGQTGTSAQGGTNISGMSPAASALAAQGPLTSTAGAPGGPGVYQQGQTAGNAGPASQGMNWGAQPSQSFNTPVLDALYAGQQQRMTTPAPQFNFQAKPGALTQAITG